MDDIDWAYFAGLLDADGCISISRYRSSQGRVYHMLRVVLTNGDKPTVDRLGLELGGSVYIGNRNSPAHHVTVWNWSVSGRKAIDVLRQCLKHLRIKKLRAQVAIEYGKTMTGGVLSKATIKQREKLYKRMKVLNQRGRHR